jgi:hypothetical protein
MSVDIPMLEVLLKRMETHPEEFVDDIDSRKWGGILERYSDCLTQPERDKIAQGIRNARRQMLNQKIMQRLAGEEEPTFLPMEAPNNFAFNTANRAMWQKGLEEHELQAMHDYYKKLGQAE